nr:alpha/beta hydrolase [Hyphomonas sp. Mor2]
MADPQPFEKAREAVGTASILPLAPEGSDREAAVEYYELTATESDLPTIVMFASAGREASDFNELAGALNAAGYPILMIEAPGIGRSVASSPAPNLYGLARDAHGVFENRGPVIFIGHAFGNRVARASATLFQDQAAGVILIASGGQKPIATKAAKALRDSFDPSLSLDARTQAVRYAFFADGNHIPDYWLRGWHAQTGRLQGGASPAMPSDEWTAGGTSPMLVIAGLQDTIAPPEDTIDLLERAHPDRVTGVRLEGAGHALLPEKPAEIAEAILTWLSGLPEMETSK